MPATHEDASVLVQLLQWGATMGLDEAAATVLDEGFDPDTASANDPAVRKMLMFFETIGTFTKQGVLDRALVLDLWWVSGVWARVGPAALRQREKIGEARLYENFEALAAG